MNPSFSLHTRPILGEANHGNQLRNVKNSQRSSLLIQEAFSKTERHRSLFGGGSVVEILYLPSSEPGLGLAERIATSSDRSVDGVSTEYLERVLISTHLSRTATIQGFSMGKRSGYIEWDALILSGSSSSPDSKEWKRKHGKENGADGKCAHCGSPLQTVCM